MKLTGFEILATMISDKEDNVNVKSAQPAQAVQARELALLHHTDENTMTPPRRGVNWPLGVGLALVLLVMFLAIAGPALAPRDPLAENLVIQVEGKWLIPPYPIFTPGFPLGSDTFGRDLYSRLLWAVRPTMIMVLIVAVVRLLIGTLIGLLAGWSTGHLGRLLNTLIAGALSVPVLLVALGAIAIVGVELGIWAFIIGLSLTGWVETAQQVREQTRIIKGQVYIEAAHALGAANRQILASHILKQISPMIVMLFAFEASSTLMATAGLGFLGYYIGGDVWVTVGDFVARRISGMPELGQMLATSWSSLTQPWAMVATGSIVFVTVLGFNLLGEGLRQGLSVAAVRRGLVARASEAARFWLDQHVWYPLGTFIRRPSMLRGFATALLALLIFASGGWLLRGQVQSILDASPTQITTPAAGGSLPASSQAGEAPETSETAPLPAASYSPHIAWEFSSDSGFASGPVLSHSGDVLYAATTGGLLYAFSLQGEQLWQVELPAGAVGTPILDPAGNLYLTDNQAGLAKLTIQGELLWYFQSLAGSRAVSAAALGPDGRAYYTVTDGSQGIVQAVSPDGQGLWSGKARTPSFFRAPTTSPDGEFVFLKEDVFAASTGDLLDLNTDLRVLSYFAGEDGNLYLLAGNNVIEWKLAGDRVEVLEIAQWDSSGHGESSAPGEVGVTAGRVSWMLYTSPGGATSFIWVTLDDQVLGQSATRFSRGALVALGDDLTAYLCGGARFSDESAECAALSPSQPGPLWQLSLGKHGLVQGGFYRDGRLFVTTSRGKLFAIDEHQRELIAAAPGQVEPTEEPELPSDPGFLWSHKAPGLVFIGPMIGPDQGIYMITLDHLLYVLEPDGSLRASVQLKDGPYEITSSNRTSSPVWPLVLPEGVVVIFSQENSVYAFDRQGEMLWEAPLEAELHQWPLMGENGDFYFLDTNARVYAFDANGMRWSFQSETAPHSANGLAVGQDGTVYYTVTNRSQGFVQAVSAEGEGLWASAARTNSFYDNLLVSPDGALVFLKEDVFETRSGERLALDIPVRVDEFIMGKNGRLYLRSEHTVIEWQLSLQGFEIVQTAAWPAGTSFLFNAQVDQNGVIWLMYQQQLVWLASDGKVLGTRAHNMGAGAMTFMDLANTRFTECRYFAIDKAIECRTYVPQSGEPVWKVDVEGIAEVDFSILSGDHLYVLSNRNTITKIYVGKP